MALNKEELDELVILHESIVAIGRDDADNTIATTNVVANEDGSTFERLEQIQEVVNNGSGTAIDTNKSLVDAVGSNGTTLVYGSGSALGAIGTEFWVKKTVTSSDIPSGSQLAITGVSSGGELAIEDVIVKTDGTGLANGTNFELKSNNANGLANIFVETVANLGANKTMDLAGASITGIESVLETGKLLQVESTAAACTGAGTIDIYVKFMRLAAGAIVAAT